MSERLVIRTTWAKLKESIEGALEHIRCSALSILFTTGSTHYVSRNGSITLTCHYIDRWPAVEYLSLELYDPRGNVLFRPHHIEDFCPVAGAVNEYIVKLKGWRSWRTRWYNASDLYCRVQRYKGGEVGLEWITRPGIGPPIIIEPPPGCMRFGRLYPADVELEGFVVSL